MGGTGVIDHFLEVFTRYIDSGFGLLSGEVAFIATTLIVIDVTLAALFWSWGADDDIVAVAVRRVGGCEAILEGHQIEQPALGLLGEVGPVTRVEEPTGECGCGAPGARVPSGAIERHGEMN